MSRKDEEDQTATFVEPTEEQRLEALQRAQAELPELKRRSDKGIENLRRISRGLRPIR